MTRFMTGLCLLAALACAAPAEGPAIDTRAERRALMEADDALFKSHENLDEFVTYWDADATLMPADAPLARGEAIGATWEQLLTTPGFDLEWGATSAEVAEAGDLGYTMGTYKLTVAPEGEPVTTVGKYVTVWKKQDDGSWKVIVDCFNADGPPTQG